MQILEQNGVYHSAKIRNFKQITTARVQFSTMKRVFITLQRYEILSKSQRLSDYLEITNRCLSLCKDTKF